MIVPFVVISDNIKRYTKNKISIRVHDLKKKLYCLCIYSVIQDAQIGASSNYKDTDM